MTPAKPAQDPGLQDPQCVFQLLQDALSALHAGDRGEGHRLSEGRFSAGGGGLRRDRAAGQGRHHPLRCGPDAAHRRVPERAHHRHAAVAAGQRRHGRRRASNALRGESNVQGSTDMGLLFTSCPATCKSPTASTPSHLGRYLKVETPRRGLLGQHAQVPGQPAESLVGRRGHRRTTISATITCPKRAADHSWMSLFEEMHQGAIKGLWIMGQNPAVSGPNARFERKALENLDWMVIQEIVSTETTDFWRAPGVDPADGEDRGVPAACRGRHGEGRQHRHQRALHPVAAPGRGRARRRPVRSVDSGRALQGDPPGLPSQHGPEGSADQGPELGLRR